MLVVMRHGLFGSEGISVQRYATAMDFKLPTKQSDVMGNREGMIEELKSHNYNKNQKVY